MSAVNDKPKAAKKAPAKKTSASKNVAAPANPRARKTAAKTPEKAMAEIVKAIEAARDLVLGADKAAGDEGDSGSTLLFFAQIEISKALRSAAPNSDAMRDLGRSVFDIQALVQGCAALHVGDGRGLLAQQADAVLESLHPMIDTGTAFWPKAPAPEPPAAEPVSEAVPPAPAADPDAERRFDLAREVNHEIAKLAEGVIKLLEIERDDDFPMYHGMLQRIVLLSSINFFAMQLHGDGDGRKSWGDDADVGNMERAYRGFYR
ncbi:hypothetical protein [Xenophilus sp. Marseille-Q4582]|uniref:hypothetical protein n=1 Tax=Xenophilus sp. Marseille-Q4582 TaxID=2866600 RepID=UPI001CE4AB39|nr:hypothetical protein [Xenophilus sp. Marseille-Q4582]